jgi:hypothetical protein
MAVNLPSLPYNVILINPDGTPTQEFQRFWQAFVNAIDNAFVANDAAIAAIAAAQTTADTAIADAAAAAAQALTAASAALSASTDAAAAQASADAAARESARINSYTSPTNVLSGTDTGSGTAKISIANHIRVYPVQGSIAVADVNIAGVADITGLANSTLYYVYYDDITLLVTNPTCHATTTAEISQVGYASGRHFLGSITTPAAAAPPSSGGGGHPPGGELLP